VSRSRCPPALNNGRSCLPSGARAIMRGQITEAEQEYLVFCRLGGAPFSAAGPAGSERPLGAQPRRRHMRDGLIGVDWSKLVIETTPPIVISKLRPHQDISPVGPGEGRAVAEPVDAPTSPEHDGSLNALGLTRCADDAADLQRAARILEVTLNPVGQTCR